MVMRARLLKIAVPLALVAALLLAFAPAAFAQTEGAPTAPQKSFHREFGLFYDEAGGNVYVSDSLNNRIIRTKMDGTGWTVLGRIGSGVKQFHDPRGIYYDSASGYIYVTDCGNHRIVRTKMDGSGWATLGSLGKGSGQFYYPRGIWYDAASDLIYVPDTGNHRIVRTKIDGTGWATLGSEGIGPQQFMTPRGVQYDEASGLLYIADTGNNRVVRCAWDGSGWTTLGTRGVGTKQFREPRGIHYDAATATLYVADHGNHRIVSTKMDGSGWKTFGTFGSGQNQFFYPRGVSLDAASGDVYVADTFNDRIVKTQMDGTGWQTLGVRWRPYVWHFAEGTTRTDFAMFLTICNPGTTDAQVNVQYMLGDGTQIPQKVTVIAHSRYTINVNQVVGAGKDVSLTVTSNSPVIVERPMYFHYGKARWPGGDVVMGKPQADTDFFFAEGTTRENFHTYLCMQNPNETAANVTVTYMFDGADPQTQALVLDPHSRKTIDVNEAVGSGRDVSITVSSDIPILAERPMYFKFNGKITGGHVVVGATEPDTHFFLAEGTTRNGFQEYLCLLNPGDTEAHVTLRYMFTDGTIKELPITVAPKSRHTEDVNRDVGGDKDVAVEIISDQPIVVERPMYFVYRGANGALIFGGHNVIAASDPGTSFTFAEGTTRPGFEEWICLFNPGDADASVTLTYMFSNGGTQTQTLTVGAHCRATIAVNQIVPAGSDVSINITSSQPIVTERPIYFNYNGNTTGGSDTMGFSE
jgi:DNA-binding beta-propeller fold protein YncE